MLSAVYNPPMCVQMKPYQSRSNRRKHDEDHMVYHHLVHVHFVHGL